jgi:hypothetical protein
MNVRERRNPSGSGVSHFLRIGFGDRGLYFTCNLVLSGQLKGYSPSMFCSRERWRGDVPSFLVGSVFAASVWRHSA